MSDTAKEILVAAYYFPPYAAVSGVRVTKLCKYLPENDWRPHVLTVDPRYYRDKVADTLPDEIAGMQITRLPYFSLPGNVVMMKLLFPAIVAWHAWRMRKKLDAVFLSGSPYHPFMITPLLGILGLKSVIDFRDSWSLNPHLDAGRHGAVRSVKRWLRGLVEVIAIRHASLVTFASKRLMTEYTEALPRYTDRFHTIYNGYDPADFVNVQPRDLGCTKSIILTGKLHYYTPELTLLLLDALREIPSLTLVYVGEEHARIRELAESRGVEDQVIALSYQPYNQVLQLIAGADYGLMTNHLQNGIGTKIFDYLALHKRVLCFVPQDSTVTVEFQGVDAVRVHEAPHSASSVETALKAMLAEQEPPDIDDVLTRFNRRHNARQLAGLIDAVL